MGSKKELYQSLYKFADQYRGKYVQAVVFALIGVIGGFVPFYAVARIIIQLIAKSTDMKEYVAWSVVAFAGYAVKITFTNISTSISHTATFYALKNIRANLVTKITKLPMGKILDTPSGYYKDVLVDRVESLEVTLAHLLPEMTANTLGPVFLILYLFIVDWRMALISLITIPIGMVFMVIMIKPYAKKYEESVKVSKRMNQTIVEYVNGIEVIKAFNQSAKSYRKYSDAVKENADYFFQWMKSCQWPMSAYNAICPSTLVTVLPVGYLFFMNHSLSAADFITIIILALSSIGPLMTSMNYTDSLAIAGTIIGEIESILSEKELIRPEAEADLKNFDIELSDVTFSYNGKENVLENINLQIKSGTVTALVGPSGSGKSSIAKLIAGFWDVTGGEIRLGGVTIQNIPQNQLADSIAYVAQDNYLFNETIMENIRFGKRNAADQEVIEAAKASGCDEFISRLQDGYQTVVGGAGAHLSGGERQRIAIARAMLKNAPIVILDEATAYTDPENEAVIQKSVSKLVAGKTLIVIAHRLSTITDSDQIILVNQGRIEGKGTHEELLGTSGLYEEMWKAHIGGKDEE